MMKPHPLLATRSVTDHIRLQTYHTHTHSHTQYIRQLIDSSGAYNIGKRNTFASIEDLSLFTSLTTNIGHTTISPRLKRHFAIVHLPELSGIPLTSILTETLWTLCGGVSGTTAGSQIDRDKLTSIVKSSEVVFLKVRAALKESDMPGRQHYVFSLSQIESVFQVWWILPYR